MIPMAALPYDVFLSHSSKDKDFVQELYRRLTRDGVRCFFDIESIGWGDNWVRALERAIDECRDIVFVLSPDFCDSQWVEVERTSAIAGDPSGLKRKVRPLMLHDCRHLPTFPRFLRNIQAIDVSTTTAFEQNYPRICRELGGHPQPDLAAQDRNKLPPVHRLPDRNSLNLHSLGDKFIGRINEMWSLHDSLFRDSTTVLQGTGVVTGAGGLGKTQLAIEYAHRFGPVYPGGVYWVHADRGRNEMITRISTAAAIEIDTKAEETEQVAQLWRELNARNLACLIILDNLPEDVRLHDYLPNTGRLHTIITTRRQDLDKATVRLPVLSIPESVQLLNSGARNLGPSAERLAVRLGGHPLALELSKSYLNYSQDLTVPALIEEMNREGELSVLKQFASDYKDHLPSGHDLDVASTFQLSWNIASDPAKKILRVIGELAPAPVPRKLLRLVLELPEQSALRDELSKGINDLVRLSLVELSSSGDPLAHRLILAFARYRNAVDNASPLERCREVISEQMQKANQNPDVATTRELESFLPHAEFLASDNQLNPQVLAVLLSYIGIHYRTMGRFTTARDAHSTALGVAENSFAPGHPSIAASQSNLATELRDLGHLEKASDLLRKALASDEQFLAPGHPSIAIRQSNLALVLKDLGQLEEARDLLRQSLASNEQSFAPGHPSIAISQSNLAQVLRDLGQLEEARDLLRQTLASNERSYVPGHPSIAISQSNLALVLKDLGELEDARDLLRRALASDEQSFAPGHPSIARSQSNLALVLQGLGQLEEAQDQLRKALACDEQSFATGHPSIATRQSNLALVLQDLGQSDEARDLLRKSYSAFLERLGPDHPSTKTVKANLDSLPEQ
jgi:tetratricopeptide (TPR) repeat protein